MFKRIVKGFTLIELLIVIAIIGVLAVAFLPSVLNAPAKGRDAARVADIQKIQKVLLNYNLEGKAYPVDPVLLDGNGNAEWETEFGKDFGGKLPQDPQEGKGYEYVPDPDGNGTYSFVLVAYMETETASNGDCNGFLNSGSVESIDPADESTWCYGVLVE